MKFTCDSCSAHYMISDEKVGPNGVKVRCKKCGHIVLVRRPSADALSPLVAPSAAPATGEPGLDAELGQAFEAMMGESQRPPPGEPVGEELEPTQVVPPEELARFAAASVAPAAGANGAAALAAEPIEWYVAIHDRQVGPLAPPAVKDRWEAGELGPDSLVWRPGMDDWMPLSAVWELAEALAPVPRRPARPRVESASSAQDAAGPAAEKRDGSPEPLWQPDAAGALAALANEELSSLAQPEPPKSAAAAKPAGKNSLIDAMNLPDAGGIDPTGAIPLPIKGLETTGEQPLKRRSSVAKSTAELRTRRSMNRVGFIAVAVAVAAVASVAALFVYIQRFRAETAALTRAPSAPASLPAPAPPAPAAPAPAAQAQPAGQVAVGQAQPAAAGEPPPPPGAPAQQPAPQPPAASGAVAAAAPPPAAPASRRKARPEAAADRPRKRATRVAVAPPVAPAEEAPAPAEPPRKKPAGDPLLDFGGDAESDIEKELGAKKRSVYVPPAPGSDLPEKVSEAQINEGVASRMAALRECLSKQEAADPGSHGVLKVRWLIGPDGGVSGVKSLTPEFASQPIAACLTGVVKSIRFPRSHTTGQEVIFPFKF